jgi:hypothetical protein
MPLLPRPAYGESIDRLDVIARSAATKQSIFFLARRDGLLRCARNDEESSGVAPTRWLHPRQGSDLPAMANQIRAFGLRQINPTGKSPKVCPAPREKILRFCRRANQR